MFAIYKARDLMLGCTSSKEKLELQAQAALQVIKYVSRIEHTVDIDKIRSILCSALNIVVYAFSFLSSYILIMFYTILLNVLIQLCCNFFECRGSINILQFGTCSKLISTLLH